MISKDTRKSYSRIVEPCVSATERFLFYRLRYYIGQMLVFKGYDRESDFQFVISEVANGENLERRFEEELAPSVGYIDQLDLSWEEKQWELERVMQGDMKLAGLIRLFYKPIYVPMINLGSQLCIFNHVNNILELYDTNGALKRKVPITYHQIKKWDERIMHDEATGKIYTTYDHSKGKLVRSVNLENGILGPPVLIDCAFIEKMKVNDGVLYYLESGRAMEDHNRVLHKVKL